MKYGSKETLKGKNTFHNHCISSTKILCVNKINGWLILEFWIILGLEGIGVIDNVKKRPSEVNIESLYNLTV